MLYHAFAVIQNLQLLHWIAVSVGKVKLHFSGLDQL